MKITDKFLKQIINEGLLNLFKKKKSNTDIAFEHNLERFKNLVSERSLGNLRAARDILHTFNLGLKKDKIKKLLGEDAWEVLKEIYIHGQNKNMKTMEIIKLLDDALAEAAKYTKLR